MTPMRSRAAGSNEFTLMKCPRRSGTALMLIMGALVVGAMRQGGRGDTNQPGEVALTKLESWRPPTGAWLSAKDVHLNDADPTKLGIETGEGVFVNGTDGRTTDLLSRAEFGDVQVHVEFCIPKNSNSGVYLM